MINYHEYMINYHEMTSVFVVDEQAKHKGIDDRTNKNSPARIMSKTLNPILPYPN